MFLGSLKIYELLSAKLKRSALLLVFLQLQ